MSFEATLFFRVRADSNFEFDFDTAKTDERRAVDQLDFRLEAVTTDSAYDLMKRRVHPDYDTELALAPRASLREPNAFEDDVAVDATE